MYGEARCIAYHSHDKSDNTEAEGCQRREAMRENLGIVPALEIVVGDVAFAEDEVLGDDDDEVRRGPFIRSSQPSARTLL